MKTWLLTMSCDGNDIDAEEIITSDTEPNFWDCYEIAERNRCEFFSCEPLD